MGRGKGIDWDAISLEQLQAERPSELARRLGVTSARVYAVRRAKEDGTYRTQAERQAERAARDEAKSRAAREREERKAQRRAEAHQRWVAASAGREAAQRNMAEWDAAVARLRLRIIAAREERLRRGIP